MLNRIQHIHFIGIGGAGLSAIAKVLIEQGKTVTGSDQILSATTESLAALGARVYKGQRAENLGKAELVVVSSAVPANNLELVAAHGRGIPVVKRDAVLREMMEQKTGLAIAGTHGKTTTTAMVAFCLSYLQLDPTFIVGGTLVNFGSNAGAGQGKYFVVEADEYDRMFLRLNPTHAIVTNVEFDHPDCFADETDMLNAFKSFVTLPSLSQNGGAVIIGGDSANARVLQGSAYNSFGYGFGEQNDYRIIDPQSNAQTGSDFVVAKNRRSLAVVHLNLPGRHNMLNACATLALCDQLKLDLARVTRALAEFRGTLRRFELKGESAGITVIDDYAHHPTEIKATLAAARECFNGRRIWAIFQPHTYSRTRALLADFAQAFGDADEVILTEIFPARETETLGVSSEQIAAQMNHPHKRFIATLDETVEFLQHHLQAGDVLITLGAGDVNQVGMRLLEPAAVH